LVTIKVFFAMPGTPLVKVMVLSITTLPVVTRSAKVVKPLADSGPVEDRLVNIPLSPETSDCKVIEPAMVVLPPTNKFDDGPISVTLLLNELVLTTSSPPISTVDPPTAKFDVCPEIAKLPVIVSPAFSTLSDAAPVTVPTKSAVIVPAAKLLELSRSTKVFAILLAVPVVAEFSTLPALLIVANLVSVIAADALISLLVIEPVRFSLEYAMAALLLISALVIRLDDKRPTLSACIIPAPNACREVLPPMVALPSTMRLFDAPLICNDPVIVSPALSTFCEAAPIKLAVIVPAVKLPEASRCTIVFGVLVLVAALAAVVADETLAAVCPPTVDTTVAFCVPVTSPIKLPVK